MPWLRRLGVEAVVRSGAEPVAGLAPLAREERWGVATELLAVDSPAPAVAWPRAVAVAPGPRELFEAVAAGRVGDDVALVARPLAHAAGGSARLVEAGADRLVVEVDSGGGLVVLRRAFQPLYRARLEDGTAVPTLPVDLALLGVEVPPGRHRLTVAIGAGPERAAAGLALAVGAAALAGAFWRRR